METNVISILIVKNKIKKRKEKRGENLSKKQKKNKGLNSLYFYDGKNKGKNKVK